MSSWQPPSSNNANGSKPVAGGRDSSSSSASVHAAAAAFRRQRVLSEEEGEIGEEGEITSPGDSPQQKQPPPQHRQPLIRDHRKEALPRRSSWGQPASSSSSAAPSPTAGSASTTVTRGGAPTDFQRRQRRTSGSFTANASVRAASAPSASPASLPTSSFHPNRDREHPRSSSTSSTRSTPASTTTAVVSAGPGQAGVVAVGAKPTSSRPTDPRVRAAAAATTSPPTAGPETDTPSANHSPMPSSRTNSSAYHSKDREPSPTPPFQKSPKVIPEARRSSTHNNPEATNDDQSPPDASAAPPQLPMPTQPPEPLGSYSSLAASKAATTSRNDNNNSAEVVNPPAPNSPNDGSRVFPRDRDHIPRERDAPVSLRGADRSSSTNSTNSTNKDFYGGPPSEQPSPRMARTTSADLGRHHGGASSSHHDHHPPRSPMQQPPPSRGRSSFSSPHTRSPGGTLVGPSPGGIAAASPVPPFPSPAAAATTSPAISNKSDVAMPQQQQPHRPAFHRNDPRFAKQQQQLQQQQHLQRQTSFEQQRKGSLPSSFELPLRRSNSSDISGIRRGNSHNKPPALAFGGDMMVRRSSSSDIPERPINKDRPHHARSWSATASHSPGTNTAATSGHHHPHHPGLQSARKGNYPPHHHHESSAGGGEPPQRRRPSYPASPGGMESFGRTREWQELSSSPRSIRKSVHPLSSPYGHGPAILPGGRGSDDMPKFPTPTARRTGPTHSNDHERRSTSGSYVPHHGRPGSSQSHNSMSSSHPDSVGSMAAADLGPSSPTQVKNKPPVAAAPEIAKKPPSPLLTSVLGDATVVSRAEAAVKDLSTLLSNPQLLPSEGNQSSLPNKHLIMKSVAILNMKIKQAETEASKAEEAVHAAKRLEREEKEQQRQKLLEDETGMAKEREREWQERKRKHEEEHGMKLKDIITKRRAALDEEQKQADEDLAKKIQEAQQAKRTVLQDEIKEHIKAAAELLNHDIAKVRKEYDRVFQAAAKSESKAMGMEAEYRQVQAAYKDLKRDGADGEKSLEKDPSDVVALILAENQRKAMEGHTMCLFVAQGDHSNDINLANEVDPKFFRTNAEWSTMTKAVTGPADSLYSDPSEAPYFEENEKTHRRMGSIVKEYVRQKKRKLDAYLTELAEEYDYRRRKYTKQMQRRGHHAKHSGRASLSVARQSILGGKASSSNPADILGAASGRATGNPYRRARRGNEVRSEYEQEQIIAEIAAKEAMEKRIAFGGCELPRQRCKLDEVLTSTYINTLKAQKVDPIAIEKESSLTNAWTDMEKCIFLDRFLQHPKDFRKIASFLRNKTTKDCVSFYYDSKQTVPYKAALKEHMMRRKRRGDYPIWDATIQAAISTGAVVTAGSNEQKPLVFTLPVSDGTYFTRDLHPLKREVFDKMPVVGRKVKAKMPMKTGKYANRRREPFFLLDSEHKKYLTANSKDCLISSATPVASKKKSRPCTVSGELPEAESTAPEKLASDVVDPGRSTPTRRAPQKWTAAEKKTFLETLDKHGRNWEQLSAAVGTKTISQIKNYYYDYKKQVGKFRLEKKTKGGEESKLKKGKVDDETKGREDADSGKPSREAASSPPEAAEDDADQEVAQHLGLKDTSRESNGTRSLESETRYRDHEMRLQQQLHEQQELEEQQRLLQEQQQQLEQRQLEREILHRQEQQRQQQQQMEQQHQQALQHHALQQRSLLQQQWQQQQQLQRQRQQQQAQLQQQSHQQRHHQFQQAHTQQQQLQQLHVQNHQQQQHLQRPNRVESGGDTSTSSSTNRNADSLAAELWSQAQQQAVLNQHAAGHLSVEEARRLLQHHSQSHHQQVLSNLLPWVSSAQVAQAQATSLHQEGGGHNSIQDWSDATAHLQNLMSLRQSGGGHGLLALAGLSSRNPGAAFRDNPGNGANPGGGRAMHSAGMASQQQQQQQPDGSNDQLALAQRLLAFSGSGHAAEGRRDVSSLDALGLLALAAPRADGGGNPSNSYRDQGRDPTGQQNGQPER